MTQTPNSLRMLWQLRSHSRQTIATTTIVATALILVPSEFEDSRQFEQSVNEPTTISHRNERSTPRVSILPFSPATAIQKKTEDANTVVLAKAVLLQLGYSVGRLDNRVSAKFKSALFRYQRAHAISTSGSLDDATLKSLGISGK
ncbi:MAG: peptidoglycan-binding domain-containing protein [Albidovulum sp.]|nr:peptidoglycan-binding domain-containing protein [Albidovulum sp.]